MWTDRKKHNITPWIERKCAWTCLTGQRCGIYHFWFFRLQMERSSHEIWFYIVWCFLCQIIAAFKKALDSPMDRRVDRPSYGDSVLDEWNRKYWMLEKTYYRGEIKCYGVAFNLYLALPYRPRDGADSATGADSGQFRRVGTKWNVAGSVGAGFERRLAQIHWALHQYSLHLLLLLKFFPGMWCVVDARGQMRFQFSYKCGFKVLPPSLLMGSQPLPGTPTTCSFIRW